MWDITISVPLAARAAAEKETVRVSKGCLVATTPTPGPSWVSGYSTGLTLIGLAQMNTQRTVEMAVIMEVRAIATEAKASSTL